MYTARNYYLQARAIALDTVFREVLGTRIRVYDSQTNGSPVLLIHGLGGSIDSWEGVIDALASMHRILAVDLPGFGQSDKPKMKYSISFYADFVARFIESVSPPISIIGSSLGGQISAEIAIKYPKLISKLVLISPAGVPPVSFKGGPALKRYAQITKTKGGGEVKRLLDSIDSSKPVTDNYAKLVYDRISMPGAREAFASALKESAKAKRLTKRVGRIHCPLMVLWGQNDSVIPPKYATPFIGMDNCRLVLIDRCGHRPHAEVPDLFQNLLLSFLAN